MVWGRHRQRWKDCYEKTAFQYCHKLLKGKTGELTLWWTTTTTTNPLMFGINLSKKKEHFNRKDWGSWESCQIRGKPRPKCKAFQLSDSSKRISVNPASLFCSSAPSNCSYETIGAGFFTTRQFKMILLVLCLVNSDLGQKEWDLHLADPPSERCFFDSMKRSRCLSTKTQLLRLPSGFWCSAWRESHPFWVPFGPRCSSIILQTHPY